jgi:tRNA modification GTPase
VRISGRTALVVAQELFRPASGATIDGAPEPPCFGRFVDGEGRHLDHGFLVVFPPHGSFTGEMTAELWPHGSPAVLAELVRGAVAAGAVLAGPGEFTYRALRNGRIDLVRAEAVRDLVEARTLYQARVAFAQAEGALSRRLAPLRQQLEEWLARGEAAVEFVEESDVHLPAGELHAGITAAAATCETLLAGFRTGRVVRDGASLVIAGCPNAGKSSLFNRLLERDRAIVTDVAGTTRDTLEEALDLEGIPLRLIDTAGLRDPADPVENEGVRRAREAREEADLILLVVDGSRPLEAVERDALARMEQDGTAKRTTVVVNKCDLEEGRRRELPHRDALRVSALTGEGFDALRAQLRGCLIGTSLIEDPILTNARHAEALERARTSLATASEAASSGLSEELVLEDLRQALRHLGEITGEFTSDDLYDRIFSTFCIGK